MTNKNLTVALLGFGVVGSGTAQVITENQDRIRRATGRGVDIRYILDLREFPDSPFADRIVHDYNIIVSDPEVDVVVEMMGGSHPAYEFSRAALEAGKSVVTSNKEVVANFGTELLALAADKGVRYLFEASVGGGIPVLRPLAQDMAANRVCSINGILNGTTNYILTRMFAEGASFDAALAEAMDDDLIGMFTPFGRVAPELGQKLLNEVLVLDVRTNVPILSIQPFGQQGYDYAVKIRTMNVANHDDLQRMVSYQIRKFNACRKCLKCESLCKAGAISIVGDNYYINPDKCVHCKMCVTPKYLDGGCMMDKYLRTK